MTERGVHSLYGALALGGGVLLATMISLNSQVAQHSSPWMASWIAHGIGGVVALVVIRLVSGGSSRRGNRAPSAPKAPKWAYLGGLPGAMTVVLAAICVNSPLGLSATLVLGLTGQILTGMLSDRFGWFGLPRRPLGFRDLQVAAVVLAGSGLLILSKV